VFYISRLKYGEFKNTLDNLIRSSTLTEAKNAYLSLMSHDDSCCYDAKDKSVDDCKSTNSSLSNSQNDLRLIIEKKSTNLLTIEDEISSLRRLVQTICIEYSPLPLLKEMLIKEHLTILFSLSFILMTIRIQIYIAKDDILSIKSSALPGIFFCIGEVLFLILSALLAGIKGFSRRGVLFSLTIISMFGYIIVMQSGLLKIIVLSINIFNKIIDPSIKFIIYLIAFEALPTTIRLAGLGVILILPSIFEIIVISLQPAASAQTYLVLIIFSLISLIFTFNLKETFNSNLQEISDQDDYINDSESK